LWLRCTKLASYHQPDAKSFEVATRYFENFCTPALRKPKARFCHEISKKGGQEEGTKAINSIISVEFSTANFQIIYFGKKFVPIKCSLSVSNCVNHAKTGHGPHCSNYIFVLFYVLFFVLFCVLFDFFCRSVYCLCVNVYCTTATGCQPNCS
jgi:hypothetical protein